MFLDPFDLQLFRSSFHTPLALLWFQEADAKKSKGAAETLEKEKAAEVEAAATATATAAVHSGPSKKVLEKARKAANERWSVADKALRAARTRVGDRTQPTPTSTPQRISLFPPTHTRAYTHTHTQPLLVSLPLPRQPTSAMPSMQCTSA